MYLVGAVSNQDDSSILIGSGFGVYCILFSVYGCLLIHLTFAYLFVGVGVQIGLGRWIQINSRLCMSIRAACSTVQQITEHVYTDIHADGVTYDMLQLCLLLAVAVWQQTPNPKPISKVESSWLDTTPSL